MATPAPVNRKSTETRESLDSISGMEEERKIAIPPKKRKGKNNYVEFLKTVRFSEEKF